MEKEDRRGGGKGGLTLDAEEATSFMCVSSADEGQMPQLVIAAEALLPQSLLLGRRMLSLGKRDSSEVLSVEGVRRRRSSVNDLDELFSAHPMTGEMQAGRQREMCAQFFDEVL